MKIVFTLALFVCSLGLFSQPLTPDVVSIEMRDGKFLAADVYVPDADYSRPTILIQTPYNKFYYRYYLPLNIGLDIANSPYNFVIVDWRGFYGSASAAVVGMNRGEDGYDVIDWIVAQEWSDGKVGTWGASALGKIQFETAREQHPAHICACPLVASPEFLYQTYYPNGDYRTEYVEQLDALGYGMSTTLLANPHYNLTWQYIENQNYYPEEIHIPMLMIGGWYDHTTEEMIKYFDAIRQNSPAGIAEQHRLLMGPWAHGGFGPTQVGTVQQGDLEFPEAAGWSNDKAVEFFAYYLGMADNGWLSFNPVIQYFQMGDMTWHGTEVWPPSGLTPEKYYFNADGSLTVTAPLETNSFSEIVYDPRDPSPTVGGETLRADLLQGPYDQAPVVESRNDILIFTSDELSEPVKHTGNVNVKLFVSSDRLDTDFAVRLCDVYPDNRSMILRDNIFRMRFRDGFTVNDTNFIQAGEIYEIDIKLANTAHTFLPGHKIRVDITSSDYPRFNNNMNDGGEMYVSGDTLIATNHVYHDQTHASYVEFYTDNSVNSGLIVTSTETYIYPNPVNESGEVIVLSQDNISGIRLYNISGTEILKIDNLNNSNALIPVSGLCPGLYFVEIVTESGLVVKKLIVE